MIVVDIIFFCEPEIREWLREKDKCPVCRRQIKQIYVIGKEVNIVTHHMFVEAECNVCGQTQVEPNQPNGMWYVVCNNERCTFVAHVQCLNLQEIPSTFFCERCKEMENEPHRVVLQANVEVRNDNRQLFRDANQEDRQVTREYAQQLRNRQQEQGIHRAQEPRQPMPLSLINLYPDLILRLLPEQQIRQEPAAEHEVHDEQVFIPYERYTGRRLSEEEVAEQQRARRAFVQARLNDTGETRNVPQVVGEQQNENDGLRRPLAAPWIRPAEVAEQQVVEEQQLRLRQEREEREERDRQRPWVAEGLRQERLRQEREERLRQQQEATIVVPQETNTIQTLRSRIPDSNVPMGCEQSGSRLTNSERQVIANQQEVTSTFCRFMHLLFPNQC